MSEPLRLLRTGLGHAVDNICLTAAMAQLRLTGAVPDTVRLYTYRESVLLGRSQDVDTVDHAACRAANVAIARRMTGGGAVYMAPGVLAWDMVTTRKRFASLDIASQAICGAVAAALRDLGLAARFRAPGDIVVGQKKVSGSAGWFEDDCLIHQGTVLVDCDFARMAQLLRLPAGDLPVAAIADLGATAPDMKTLDDALARAFAGLGDLVAGVVTERENECACRIRGEEAWIAVAPGHEVAEPS